MANPEKSGSCGRYWIVAPGCANRRRCPPAPGRRRPAAVWICRSRCDPQGRHGRRWTRRCPPQPAAGRCQRSTRCLARRVMEGPCASLYTTRARGGAGQAIPLKRCVRPVHFIAPVRGVCRPLYYRQRSSRQCSSSQRSNGKRRPVIRQPDPKPDVMARRDSIVAGLRGLLPESGVIAEPLRLKPYETDGLSAYRQMPLAVVLPETTEQVAAVHALLPRERRAGGPARRRHLAVRRRAADGGCGRGRPDADEPDPRHRLCRSLRHRAGGGDQHRHHQGGRRPRASSTRPTRRASSPA